MFTALRIASWTVLAVAALWIGINDPGTEGRGPGPLLVPDLRDVPYREGHSHCRLDVYLPRAAAGSHSGEERRGAILAIHGGSWIGGSRREYGPQVARFAAHGYAVFVVDYRLAVHGRPSWPDVLEDLRESVRWIRRNARELRVDPHRLVAFGTSAGGHLASLLGTNPPDPAASTTDARVQAVVNFQGPCELEELQASRFPGDDSLENLLGGGHGSGREALAREASPRAHVSGDDPPMLLVHGLDDRWVLPEQSRRMADRLGEVGVRHRLVLIPGARHGFEMLIGSPAARDLLPEVLEFLGDVWKAGTREG